jgi:preprotein translocase subunit YajC
MNFSDLTAYAAPAAGAAQGTGSMISAFLPFILIIAIMYFLMIRPQKKKEKLKQEMLSQLIVGDKILTIGGIHGKIVSVKDDILVIETGEASNDKKSYIKITRWAVSEVTKPGEEPKDKKEEATEIEKLNDNE